MRPKGMTRKAYRDMRAIAAWLIGRPVVLDVNEGREIVAYHGEPHDEGFSAELVLVFEVRPGHYAASIESWGSDCDGRHRSHQTGSVYRGKGRKPWRYVREDSSQRDYTAEASGY